MTGFESYTSFDFTECCTKFRRRRDARNILLKVKQSLSGVSLIYLHFTAMATLGNRFLMDSEFPTNRNGSLFRRAGVSSVCRGGGGGVDFLRKRDSDCSSIVAMGKGQEEEDVDCGGGRVSGKRLFEEEATLLCFTKPEVPSRVWSPR